jgi:CRP-like cAMP-binding protein
MDSLLLANIISKIPLFQNLNETQAQKLIQSCTRIELKPDDALMRGGSTATDMFLLLAGSLKVTLEEQNIVVAKMKNVGVIGEMEVLLNQPCVATVTADAPSNLLKISKQQLDALFSEDVEMELKIYKNLCKVLCEKIVSTNNRLQDFSKCIDPAMLKKLQFSA